MLVLKAEKITSRLQQSQLGDHQEITYEPKQRQIGGWREQTQKKRKQHGILRAAPETPSLHAESPTALS